MNQCPNCARTNGPQANDCVYCGAELTTEVDRLRARVSELEAALNPMAEGKVCSVGAAMDMRAAARKVLNHS